MKLNFVHKRSFWLDYPQDILKSDRKPNKYQQCSINFANLIIHKTYQNHRGTQMNIDETQGTHTTTTKNSFLLVSTHIKQNLFRLILPTHPSTKTWDNQKTSIPTPKNLNWTFPGEPTTELGSEKTIPHPKSLHHVYNSKTCCMFWENFVQWFEVAKASQIVQSCGNLRFGFFKTHQSWLTKFHKNSCLPTQVWWIWSIKS